MVWRQYALYVLNLIVLQLLGVNYHLDADCIQQQTFM